MRTLTTAMSCLVVLAAAPALAGPPAKWNAKEGEKAKALELKGNAKRGAEAYEVCSTCHLPTGAGRADGTFPNLAGQHRTVLVKQIADIRSGLRDNPVMHPFSISLTGPQELADVAEYLHGLPVPTDNGKGPGTDLALGKKLYDHSCARCHLAKGDGDDEKFYPVLAGQHYKYLVRQAQEIRDGKRGNANPEMMKVIKGRSDKELDAISDYLSRLHLPAEKPAKK